MNSLFYLCARKLYSPTNAYQLEDLRKERRPCNVIKNILTVLNVIPKQHEFLVLPTIETVDISFPKRRVYIVVREDKVNVVHSNVEYPKEHKDLEWNPFWLNKGQWKDCLSHIGMLM